jgi:hypothetical protein
MGSMNARRERERERERERKGDPSSSQSYLQQLHVALLFLLPNRNLNQTSRECLVNVSWRVEILREDWTTT